MPLANAEKVRQRKEEKRHGKRKSHTENTAPPSPRRNSTARNAKRIIETKYGSPGTLRKPAIQKTISKAHRRSVMESNDANHHSWTAGNNRLASPGRKKKKIAVQMRDTEKLLRGRGRSRSPKRPSITHPNDPQRRRSSSIGSAASTVRGSSKTRRARSVDTPTRRANFNRSSSCSSGLPTASYFDCGSTAIGSRTDTFSRARSSSAASRAGGRSTSVPAAGLRRQGSKKRGRSPPGIKTRCSSPTEERNRPPSFINLQPSQVAPAPSDKRNLRNTLKEQGRMDSGAAILSDNIDRAKVVKKGDKTVLLVPVTAEEAKEIPKEGFEFEKTGRYGRFRRLREEMETPPRSLVLIWVLFAAEMSFDLGTTVIAFQNLLGKDDCCGYQMDLGPIPMSVTTPFLFLVVAELAFLFRAMALTLWPSLLDTREKDVEEGGKEISKRYGRDNPIAQFCCGFLRWNAKAVLRMLNFLVLLNPFFGCIIAWILLYQSDKRESFIVLGLEGATIILHYISVWLEGGLKTYGGIAFNSIPLIPFFISISLVLIYLRQGGVCYLVEQSKFVFSGCEVCPTGLPPIENNVCLFSNGTNVTLADTNIFDTFNGDEGNIFKSPTEQGRYCAYNHPEGPQDINFCFFEY